MYNKDSQLIYKNYVDTWSTDVAIEKRYQHVVLDGVPIKGAIDKMEFDGWVRNAVKAEIEKVSDEDVPKLFSDCRFLTDKVSKGMIQGFGDNILATGIDTELGSKTGQVFKSSIQTTK